VPGLGRFAPSGQHPGTAGATSPPAQQDSGFSGFLDSVGRSTGFWGDSHLDRTGEGYVPAHDGIPAKIDEGEAKFADLTKPEAEVLGVLPAGRAVKGVKLGAEAAGAGLKAWQDSHPGRPARLRYVTTSTTT